MRKIPLFSTVKYLAKSLFSTENVTSRKFRIVTPFVNYATSIKKPEYAPPVKLDAATRDLLSKLSLVDFVDENAVANLESAVEFANQLLAVKVDEHVEPMYSVQEDCSLLLREDEVTVPNCRDQLIGLAKKSEEEYFVTPIGNVINSSKAD